MIIMLLFFLECKRRCPWRTSDAVVFSGQHLGKKFVQWHFKDVESRSSCVALRWTCCLGRTWTPVAALISVPVSYMDWQLQKFEFSGLGLFQCRCVEGVYLKDGKPRLKLLPYTKGGRIWTWFSACVGNACTAQWHYHLPSQGTACSDWHLDFLRREMLPSILPALDTYVLQNCLFWIPFLGGRFSPDIAHCIASLCPVQGCSWEIQTCCPALLASKASCWGSGPTPLLLGFTAAR